MGQYEKHVFICTTGSTCPTQADTEAYVKQMRAEIAKAGLHTQIRINKSGCFSQCGHGPMLVIYPDNERPLPFRTLVNGIQITRRRGVRRD